jgi:rhamnulokinase
MPARIARYCVETGQPVPEGPGATIRTILESLALKTRFVLGRVGSLIGWAPEVLHLVGGGARNRLLCRLTADACGVPVLAGPAEATAIGNLLVQAIAIGELASLAEGRELVQRSFEPVRYDPAASSDATEERWERFQQLVTTAHLAP